MLEKIKVRNSEPPSLETTSLLPKKLTRTAYSRALYRSLQKAQLANGALTIFAHASATFATVTPQEIFEITFAALIIGSVKGVMDAYIELKKWEQHTGVKLYLKMSDDLVDVCGIFSGLLIPVNNFVGTEVPGIVTGELADKLIAATVIPTALMALTKRFILNKPLSQITHAYSLKILPVKLKTRAILSTLLTSTLNFMNAFNVANFVCALMDRDDIPISLPFLWTQIGLSLFYGISKSLIEMRIFPAKTMKWLDHTEELGVNTLFLWLYQIVILRNSWNEIGKEQHEAEIAGEDVFDFRYWMIPALTMYIIINLLSIGLAARFNYLSEQKLDALEINANVNDELKFTQDIETTVKKLTAGEQINSANFKVKKTSAKTTDASAQKIDPPVSTLTGFGSFSSTTNSLRNGSDISVLALAEPVTEFPPTVPQGYVSCKRPSL